jgi:hypothetical protein
MRDAWPAGAAHMRALTGRLRMCDRMHALRTWAHKPTLCSYIQKLSALREALLRAWPGAYVCRIVIAQHSLPLGRGPASPGSLVKTWVRITLAASFSDENSAQFEAWRNIANWPRHAQKGTLTPSIEPPARSATGSLALPGPPGCQRAGFALAQVELVVPYLVSTNTIIS